MRDQRYRPKVGDFVEFVSLAEVDASYPARITRAYVNRTKVDIQWILPNGRPGPRLIGADTSRIVRQIEEPEREACPVEDEHKTEAKPDEPEFGELTMSHMGNSRRWRIEVWTKTRCFVVFVSDSTMVQALDGRAFLPCELGTGFETLVGDKSDG